MPLTGSSENQAYCHYPGILYPEERLSTGKKKVLEIRKMLKTPYVPCSVLQSCGCSAIPPSRAGCQISDMSSLGRGTRFCRSHAEECAGRREFCKAFHVSPPADTEMGEAPFPQLIFFFFLNSVLSLFHRCLKDLKKSCMWALGPDEAKAACRQNNPLLDSWMKTSLVKHQPSPGNKSLAPALQECLQSHAPT